MSRLATASTVACAALVSVGLLAGPAPAQAQGLSLGVEGGATFADFSLSDGGAELDSQTGFRVAGVLRYGFGGMWGLQSGVGLTQKGATAPPSETGLTGDLDFNLGYVEIPLLLTLDIPTGPAPVNPRLFAGPQVGFESACDVSADISGVSESVECNADALGENTLDTKSTDVSLVFGGGLDFGLGGPVALTLDGRYDLGLTDINDIQDAGATEIKNRTFSISGGLLLRLP